MFVYVMRNTKNGKVYVGRDSGSVAEMRRVKTHLQEGKKLADGGTLRNNSKIAKALAKYGAEVFEISIHSSEYKTKDDLNRAETALISELDSITNGYNILPGGQGLPSNDCVEDREMLKFYQQIRSRGAANANKKRWSLATVEQRQEWRDKLINGRRSGNWKENIKASWDRLDAEARAERGRQMKEGRPTRFVLKDKDGKEVQVETNLRSLLADLTTDISKKQIERIVRNDNFYSTEKFSIEKRHR